MIFIKKLKPKFPYGLNMGPVLNPIGSKVFHKVKKNSHKIIKKMIFIKPNEKKTMYLNGTKF
jgi:hypothetical protein